MYRQACTSVMCAMDCKDGQLELCLALLTGFEPFQDLMASPGSDRSHKVELVTDIVCNLNTQNAQSVLFCTARARP